MACDAALAEDQQRGMPGLHPMHTALFRSEERMHLYLPEGLAGCHMDVLHSWAILYPEDNRAEVMVLPLQQEPLVFSSCHWQHTTCAGNSIILAWKRL